MHVLVVDDSSVAVTGLCQLLEMDGFTVEGVQRSPEALARLEARPYGALVTDLEMPELHGLELIRAAKRLQPALPIIVVTAYSDSPASQEALALGARAVFAKPLSYPTLLAELERCARQQPG
jgi:two-component system response regulator HydG